MYRVCIVSISNLARWIGSEIPQQRGYAMDYFASWYDLDTSPRNLSRYALFVLDHNLGQRQIERIIAEIQKVRSEKIPVMVISSVSRPEDIVKLFNSGVDDYYLTPGDKEEFFARVRRLISLYPTGQEPQYPDQLELELESLLAFEVTRARRGRYPFSLVRISVDHDHPLLKRDQSIQLINDCYHALQGIFRKTDIIIGDENSLVIVCLFTDQAGIKVVLRKIIDCLRIAVSDSLWILIEIGYATFPDNASDEKRLCVYAAANREPLATAMP